MKQRQYTYAPCPRCGRLVAQVGRHMCPHRKWCRPYYRRRDVGEANECPECPDNGMKRQLGLKW